MNPANSGLFIIPLIVAITDWFAVSRGWRRARFVTKPTVIVALLGLLWFFTGFQGIMIWFALALIFSLAGDFFLITPNSQFKLGLYSFLLAHLCYFAAYTESPVPPILPGLLVLAGLLSIGVVLHLKLAEGLTLVGKESLKIPILFYQMALILMVFSALHTLWHPHWTRISAIWTSVGAFLFLFSDSVLAWILFVRPIAHGRLILTIAYHLAQISIVIGAILHFLVGSNDVF